ncbi:hypothetical protein KFE25_010687 [Diacronema lutheri]|uniref:Uncharacterized protein n=2 Tax=Diacronema lutheri TaxID=2081491 RepID=A0A8J5X8U7_DIALT|nr:hypothetical protein KFE25_010687 [Diacronema lutheri]
MVLITDPGPDPDDIKTMLISGVLHRKKEITLHAIVANDVIAAEPELFLARTREVTVMGGLTWDDANTKWRPDSSVNNGFDQPGAEAVYDFCFSRGVPLTVVSRMAVPILPMQLAKSFAVRTHCPVMTYLADAQFLGLEGLWQKLCDGKLPARCTKQWYFETFCGVGADDFAQRGYASLHKDDNINQMLNGFVKPYDVIALMAVLPLTRACFAHDAAAHYVSGGATHTLLLDEAHMIDVKHVLKLLRNTFIEVVVATRAQQAINAKRAHRESAGRAARDVPSPPPPRAEQQPALPPPIDAQQSETRLWPWPCDALCHRLCPLRAASRKPRASTYLSSGNRVGGRLRDGMRGDTATVPLSGARAPQVVPQRPEGGTLSHDAISALLEAALTEARAGQAAYVVAGVALGVLVLVACAGLFFVDQHFRQLAGEPATDAEASIAVFRTDVASILFTTGLAVLALAFQPTHRFLPVVRVASAGVCALHLAFVIDYFVEVSRPGRVRDGGGQRVWEAASFSCARLLFVLWLLRAMLLEWSRVRALALALVQTIGASAVCEALLVIVRRAWFNGFLHGARGPLVAKVTIARTVIKLVVGLLLLWPGTPRRARAIFSRALFTPWGRLLTGHARGSHAGLASIAPLLGFGSTHEREVRELMSDVAVVFFGAPIDGGSLAQLRATKRRTHGTRASSAAASGAGGAPAHAPPAPPRLDETRAAGSPNATAAGSPNAAAAGSPNASAALGARDAAAGARDAAADALDAAEAGDAPWPLHGCRPSTERKRRQTSRRRGDLASAGSGGNSGGQWDSYARRVLVRAVGARAAAGATGAPADSSGSQPQQQAATGPSGEPGGGAPREAKVDAYVVHSFYDSMDLKAAALEGWAQRWEARHGRPPTVFMDVLCADPSLRPWEHLQHMPAYLAKSKSLLILAGPTLTDRLWCMMELYTWLCVGGSLQHVHVLPLSTDEAACQKAIASFDTFAVMYARTSSDEDMQRLVLAVEIARISRFNDAIRFYLPVVRAAFERCCVPAVRTRTSHPHGASVADSAAAEASTAAQRGPAGRESASASTVASRQISRRPSTSEPCAYPKRGGS